MTAEMREAPFLILSSLASGPSHGYAMMRDVADESGGSVTLQASTLYASLERLEKLGLVVMHAEEIVDGRLRRMFRLTDEGTGRLRLEATRRRKLADRALTKLSRPGTAAIS